MRIWTATVDRIRRESAAPEKFLFDLFVFHILRQLSNVLIDQQRFVFYFFLLVGAAFSFAGRQFRVSVV
jgi:hypothetical protein